MPSNTDRIEKTVVIKAPLSRVWEAISDSRQFGTWFGMDMDRPFAPGAEVIGTISAPGDYNGLKGSFYIEAVNSPSYLSFRWHPHAVERGRDYSGEPTTLVTFELMEVPGGTQLRIAESGFDAVPEARRALAFRSNTEGWRIQAQQISDYIANAR